MATRTSRTDLPLPVQVYKFGGTSVGSPQALRAAVGHVGAVAPHVVVVVSATAGTTDLLLGAAQAALDQDDDACTRAVETFASRHVALVEGLGLGSSAVRALSAAITESAAELRALCQGVGVLRELSPRTSDAVVARGERVLARVFTASLAASGTACRYVDATELIHVRRLAGAAWPDWERTSARVEACLRPLLSKQVVAVVPGFLGRGPDGELVTLGRGGSDFSASILGRCLKASAVTLWKEVDGILTADPRHVPHARVVADLHYREAAELAYFGAKVLHPRTMAPLVELGIPLHLRNTLRPLAPGTRVAGDVAAGPYPVKALTAFLGQALLSVEGNGMMGVPGVAARTFGALSAAGHSVSMISQASSESSICLVVPGQEAEHAAAALREAFRPEVEGGLVDGVRVEHGLAVMAVVGLGMRGCPGIAARTFGALARERVNIVALAQGSSELNITVVVREEDVPTALQSLHREYQLDRVHALGEVEGRRGSLVLLGLGQIGRALARKVMEQGSAHQHAMGLTLATVALADRSGIRVNAEGLTHAELGAVLEAKESGAQLCYPRVPRARDTLRELREKVWPLPLHTPVLVDLTAAETAGVWVEALEHGFHVVTANKKPLAAPQARFDEIFALARQKGLAIRYEATVGAGLPVLDTLHKLHEVGDRVESIEGCLSGTLGYIVTQLEEGVRFSDAVVKAHALGYTEPDPRDDLGGMDVARKALILARTLGMRLDMEDVRVESLFPAELSQEDPRRFMARLVELDGEYAARAQRARRAGQVLRYVARVSAAGVEVGLREVPLASAPARLKGTDNQVVLHTRLYATNPLVVTGPGAGADVTASGVLNDIVSVVTSADRGLAASRPGPAVGRRRLSKSGAARG